MRRARRAAEDSGWFGDAAERRAQQKMENSGNEAKKYLKTKEVAILNAANYARFALKLTAIGPKRSKKQHVLRKRTQGLRALERDCDGDN
jgi:hypothetical protein